MRTPPNGSPLRTKPERFDLAVVGAGFYGSYLALSAARDLGLSTVILDRASGFLQQASFANQARVHAGYHYPRNYVTAVRSRMNAPRFIDEFRDCIDHTFEMYYAIARQFSKVTARHFERFCHHIGAPLSDPPEEVVRLFDPHLIERVYAAPEFAFDATALRHAMHRRLEDAGVAMRFDTDVGRVRRQADGTLSLHATDDSILVTAGRVFNCTYSRTNHLLHRSPGASPIALKHELTEIALVEPPPSLRTSGVTVMCGPFFSIMPFPARGLHSFTHVRYTPHGSWQDDAQAAYRDPYELLARARRQSSFAAMIRDAIRYMPSMSQTRYVESLWEVKTVLPRNEIDDGRPILFRRDETIPELVTITGSKIDNVYDALSMMSDTLRS